jgi:SAM-dependent methyltransferase
MATYAIRGGVEGKQRLDLLAQTMAGTTHALLAEVSLHQGSSCIDLGCGAGHVSRHLGKLVGPTGRVLGIDFDAVKLAAAREECERDGLANVEFRTADVANWDEPETYDLVFGRFVVSHLSDRPGMVRRMCAALRPGGRLVLEDIDYGGAFCYPPNVAFGLQCTLYCSLISRRGGDALLGPQLVGLCRDAGLDEIQMRVVQPVHTGRHPGKAMSARSRTLPTRRLRRAWQRGQSWVKPSASWPNLPMTLTRSSRVPECSRSGDVGRRGRRRSPHNDESTRREN